MAAVIAVLLAWFIVSGCRKAQEAQEKASREQRAREQRYLEQWLAEEKPLVSGKRDSVYFYEAAGVLSACRGGRGSAQASGVPWGLTGRGNRDHRARPRRWSSRFTYCQISISICIPLRTATMHEAVATFWKTSPSEEPAFLAMSWASLAM
jgi:hypothetical protein